MMRWAARLVALLVILAGGTGAFVWFKLQGGFVSRNTTVALGERLAPAFRVKTPERARFGPGPYPTILLFHGCGGLTRDGKPRPVTDTYATLAANLGVLAITVDSFTPRDLAEEDAQDNVCSGWILRGAERAGDVLAALSAIRQRSDVDPFRLALAGWSHGGWTIMDLLSFDLKDDWPHGITDRPADPLSGVAFAFLAYPHCGFPARTGGTGWRHPIPAIAVLGERDKLTPKKPCLEAFDRVRADGGTVEVTVMPGATHAFDESDLRNHPAFIHDPGLAAESHALFQQAIRDRLLP